MYRRGVLTLVASAAVLLFAVGGWLWVRGRRVSPGKFILAPPRNAVLNFQFARETAEQGNLSPCGKCRKPAFIFKIWVARATARVSRIKNANRHAVATTGRHAPEACASATISGEGDGVSVCVLDSAD